MVSGSQPGFPVAVHVDAPAAMFGRFAQAVEPVVRAWWGELGLPDRPDVSVVSDAGGGCVRVVAAGVELRVGARRWEQAVTVALGRPRLFHEGTDDVAGWVGQIWATEVEARPRITAHVLDCMLRAAPAEALAAAGLLDDAEEFVVRCGWSVAELGDPEPGSGNGDPAPSDRRALARLTAGPRSSGATIALAPAALRELTDLGSADGGPGRAQGLAEGVVRDLFTAYGVVLPRIELALAPNPDPVVRFRFGKVSSPAHLLLPPPTVVVDAPVDAVPVKDIVGTVVHAATGGRRAVVRESSYGHWELPSLDRWEHLAELLRAEAALRLGIWVPAEMDQWTMELAELPTIAGKVGAHVSDVTRRLVMDGVSVINDQPMIEAVLRELAGPSTANGKRSAGEADRLLDLMEDAARLRLGTAETVSSIADGNRAVLVGDVEVDGRSSAAIREDLLARLPVLGTTTAPVLLCVESVSRRAVATALRPLSDVVRVLSVDEFRPSAALQERLRVIAEERPS